nr:EOG090X0IC1 [Leptodora kindtii]
MTSRLAFGSGARENVRTNLVQSIPCRINHDGPAGVSSYFTPYVTEKSTDETVESSFRGYPLQGSKVELPHGFQGLIATELDNPLSVDSERNLSVTGKFDHLTCWNWDHTPGKDDGLQHAVNWLPISSVVKFYLIN